MCLHTVRMLCMSRHAEAVALAAHGVAAGLWEYDAQRPAHYVRGLRAAPWHDAEQDYAPLLTRLRVAHGMLLRAARRVRVCG